MPPDELMKRAADLALASVESGWGGPFGAVIAKDGLVVAMGQNRVLLTGDITAHAEIEAIREAVRVLNPYAPHIAPAERGLSTLALLPRASDSSDALPARARMLHGYEIYASGFPCPMCLGAIYWARLGRLYYACSVEDAREIGFDDEFQYEDLAKSLCDRRIPIEQIGRDKGLAAFEAWTACADRHPY